MAGWHHRLNGHGFGCTPGVGDIQRDVACCGSWDRKEYDMTEQLNWNWRCSINNCRMNTPMNRCSHHSTVSKSRFVNGFLMVKHFGAINISVTLSMFSITSHQKSYQFFPIIVKVRTARMLMQKVLGCLCYQQVHS